MTLDALATALLVGAAIVLVSVLGVRLAGRLGVPGLLLYLLLGLVLATVFPGLAVEDAVHQGERHEARPRLVGEAESVGDDLKRVGNGDARHSGSAAYHAERRTVSGWSDRRACDGSRS